MSLESIAKLADLTGISRETVSKKLRGFPFISGERNSKLYDSIEVLPLLYGQSNQVADLSAARARLAEKQVQKIDFDMDLKSGNFIPYETMLTHTQRVFTAFRTRMCSIPTKIAPKIAELSDPIDIEEALEEYINEALEELVDLRGFIEQYGDAPAGESSA